VGCCTDTILCSSATQDLQFSCPENDNLGLKIAVVCGVPCECGHVCLAQAGQSTEARVKNTPVAHLTLGYQNSLHQFHYLDDTIREAIQVELHPNSMNRESIQHLCWSWKSLSHALREHRNPPFAGCKQLFSGLQTGKWHFSGLHLSMLSPSLITS
jgi:hypothetical protein